MSDDVCAVVMVPIAAIAVLNPRARNKRIFDELVTSIANLGLKRPITVSARDDGGYDLVCGQGRLEAFQALGQTEIPAIVVKATKEDCYLMSLVENLARRQPSPVELLREIGVLKERGYSTAEIAAKTDLSADYIGAICYLLEHGENRLLAAVERGVMPANIAIEISRANEGDVQQALADAYENKAIPGNQVLAIRRIIQARHRLGKGDEGVGPRASGTAKVTAMSLIQAYQKEAKRQKLIVKKAELAESRLMFIVNALGRLLADAGFVSLLHAEEMNTLPRPLAERLGLEGA